VTIGNRDLQTNFGTKYIIELLNHVRKLEERKNHSTRFLTILLPRNNQNESKTSKPQPCQVNERSADSYRQTMNKIGFQFTQLIFVYKATHHTKCEQF
jgi:hypothetical protein